MKDERLPDEVTEVFQFHGEVHVIDHHGIRDFKHDGGEVEDGLDPGGGEFVDDLLGSAGGDGEDGHFDALGGNQTFHVGHRVDGHGGLDAAGALRVLIEGGSDFETFLVESAVMQQGGPEIPDADEDDWLQPGGAEHLIDLAGKHFHIVAEPAGAEISKIREVLAELRGFDPGSPGKGFGGDRLDAIFPQPLQAALIDGKPVNGFAGNIDSVRHGNGRLTNAPDGTGIKQKEGRLLMGAVPFRNPLLRKLALQADRGTVAPFPCSGRGRTAFEKLQPTIPKTMKLIPMISSGIAGPLGVLHLPRLWQKASLAAVGRLHDDYPGCGKGYDNMVLEALGLDRGEFLTFIKDKKPTYPECEAWVLAKKGGSLDAEAVRKLNAAIAGYLHDDATRKAILAESNIEDNGTIKDAVNLNNLDDWKAFHRDVLA